MSPLLSAHRLSKSFAHGPLFENISFGVFAGDHIGVIGPNGAGKSTLLKIIARMEEPDQGELSYKSGLKVAYLAQSPTLDPEWTLFHAATQGLDDPHDWEQVARVHEWISKMDFAQAGYSESTEIGTLSGGWKKKVALLCELVKKPDLLLLDEPTNHLDVESIMWLEEFMSQSEMAFLTITHDRQFLQRVSNKIFELDRKNVDGLLVVDGTYSQYLEIKGQRLEAQKSLEIKLKNTLRRETEWLSRGPKARTTKQQARIDRAENLGNQVEKVEGLNAQRMVDLEFKGVQGGVKKLIEAKGISKSYQGNCLFEKIDVTISAKTRLGLLGKNGAGKSTLIKVLLGEVLPDTGTVQRADHLKISYFEQGKDSLDPLMTVYKSVCPQGEYVNFGGQWIHVHGYLEKFLFNKDRIQTQVKYLSGGEQSRLLLARLMLTEANLLVLDEPTNDLDLETLHILEESLGAFPGGIILVSHDRMFLDNLSNEILAFENGKVERFADVFQWEAWIKTKHIESTQKVLQTKVATKPVTGKKLSYKDQRELDQMEEVIQNQEAQLTEITDKLNVEKDSKKLVVLSNQVGELQSKIDNLYRRWDELLRLKNQ